MRRIIVCEFLTMDGVLQSPGSPGEDTKNDFKWGGWSYLFWDDVMKNKMAEITSSPYDLLLGRRTYEIFAAFWPKRGGDPISEIFNKIEKYVVTTTAVGLSWMNSTRISGDVVQALKDLKTQDGPDLFVYGSGRLVQTLFKHDLIDILHTWIFPVTLGAGEKLFEEGTPVRQWKLTGSITSKTGVMVASYVPDGEVRTGAM